MRGLLLAGCAAVSLGVGGSGWEPLEAGAQPQDEPLFGVRVGDQLGVGVTTGDEMGSTRSDSATTTSLVQVQIGRNAAASNVQVEAQTLRAAEELLAAMMIGCEGTGLTGDCAKYGDCAEAYPYLISARHCAETAGNQAHGQYSGEWGGMFRGGQKLVCCMKTTADFRPRGWISDSDVHKGHPDNTPATQATRMEANKGVTPTVRELVAQLAEYRLMRTNSDGTHQYKWFEKDNFAGSTCATEKVKIEARKSLAISSVTELEAKVKRTLVALGVTSTSLAQVETEPAPIDSAESLAQVEARFGAETLRAADELLAAMADGCTGITGSTGIPPQCRPGMPESGNCAEAYPYIISKRHCGKDRGNRDTNPAKYDSASRFKGLYSKEDFSGYVAATWRLREKQGVVCCMATSGKFRPLGFINPDVHYGEITTTPKANGLTVEDLETALKAREATDSGCTAAKSQLQEELDDALNAEAVLKKKLDDALNILVWDTERPETMLHTPCKRLMESETSQSLVHTDAGTKDECKAACAKISKCKAISYREHSDTDPLACNLWATYSDECLRTPPTTPLAAAWVVVRKN